MKNILIYTALVVYLFCGTAHSEINVVDDWGRTVKLKKPAVKIISLAPHLTELVFSAKAHNALIGVSKHCDYPKSVKTLPKVSDYQSVNYEIINILQPDLILLWGAGAKSTMLNKLKELEFTTYISQPETFEDIATNLIAIGKLTGNEKSAVNASKKFIEDMGTAIYPSYRPKLLYLVWNSPPMSISNDTWIAHIISHCGATNMFGDSTSAYPILNRESLVHTPVDLIVHSLNNFDEDSAYTLLKRKTEVMHIESDFLQRPSLRLVEGKKRLCEKVAQIRRKMKNRP